MAILLPPTAEPLRHPPRGCRCKACRAVSAGGQCTDCWPRSQLATTNKHPIALLAGSSKVGDLQAALHTAAATGEL